MATVSSHSNHAGGGLVVAAAVLAAAATTSVAVVLRRRRRQRQADAHLDTSWHDPVIREVSAVKYESPNSTHQRQSIHSPSSNGRSATKPQFTPEERQQALSHVKERLAKLKAQHEGDLRCDHHQSMTPLPVASSPTTSTHANLSTPSSPLKPTKLATTMKQNNFEDDDKIATVDCLPRLLSFHCQKDYDEHSKDGTETTEQSDFFSSSSSSLDSYHEASRSPSFVSDSEFICERQPRASFSGLCHEIFALVGGIAGVVTIVNI